MDVFQDRRAIVDAYLSQLGANFPSVASIGSHSALDVAEGATHSGLKSLVVALRGKEATYTRTFATYEWSGEQQGVVDETHVVNAWGDLTKDTAIHWLRDRNAVMMPNRSLAVYLRKLGAPYSAIYGLPIPFVGNIALLQAEERDAPYRLPISQAELAQRAKLQTPLIFDSPDKIDRPVLVKAEKKIGERDFARNFFPARDVDDYHEKVKEKIAEGKTPVEQEAIRKGIEHAPIEEFIQGPLINLYYFYSPLRERVEFMGVDSRQQFGNGEEAIHMPISLRESLLSQAVAMGDSLFEAAREASSPGIIGPFAIQCIGDRHEKLRPIDLCFRIGGAPDLAVTPYSAYSFRGPMSYGRRIAKEVADATRLGRLSEILT